MQAQETQIPHAKMAISLLTAAHELIKGSGQRNTRLLHHLGALMAREHLAAEDVGNATRLLESVAGQHSDIPGYSSGYGRQANGEKRNSLSI